MNALGAVITAILAVAILALSPAGAAAAIVAGVCYLTEGQELDVAGIRMTAIRIILLVGFVRIVMRGEIRCVRFNTVDRTLLAYAVSLLVISTVRAGTVEELVYRIGMF